MPRVRRRRRDPPPPPPTAVIPATSTITTNNNNKSDNPIKPRRPTAKSLAPVAQGSAAQLRRDKEILIQMRHKLNAQLMRLNVEEAFITAMLEGRSFTTPFDRQ